MGLSVGRDLVKNGSWKIRFAESGHFYDHIEKTGNSRLNIATLERPNTDNMDYFFALGYPD